MAVFPRFGVWINQKPQIAESNSSQNVEHKSMSDEDTTNAPAKVKKVYYDKNEEMKQFRLWRDAEKKHPWYDAPPKVKVTTKNGVFHMNAKFTVGVTPAIVYSLMTETDSSPFVDKDKSRPLLDTKSSKVLKEVGPREISKLEKRLAWDFFWWSGTLPLHLIVDENRKDLTAKYKMEKMISMKVFEGSYKVEPIYVDQERLCKHKLPITQKDYTKCSDGQGKVASKVTIDQYFQPCTLLNLPPFSWYVREKTIKTTKNLLQSLQKSCADSRTSPLGNDAKKT